MAAGVKNMIRVLISCPTGQKTISVSTSPFRCRSKKTMVSANRALAWTWVTLVSALFLPEIRCIPKLPYGMQLQHVAALVKPLNTINSMMNDIQNSMASTPESTENISKSKTMLESMSDDAKGIFDTVQDKAKVILDGVPDKAKDVIGSSIDFMGKKTLDNTKKVVGKTMDALHPVIDKIDQMAPGVRDAIHNVKISLHPDHLMNAVAWPLRSPDLTPNNCLSEWLMHLISYTTKRCYHCCYCQKLTPK
ncbi:hypothetical protein CEXT_313051 [Caerostris extrusa]|uniref:Uncharacterized protein n=1 Tax=Caerostris extrusa TaxID=172846 RepID=A0AAV4MB94_CAEEX|nr:hypothetical protein CEXT_313051 [Caerostris extrusa]